MELVGLNGLYHDSSKVKELTNALREKGSAKVHLKGIVGAQLSFILAALFKNNPRSLLIICTDNEAAAYLQNDLESVFQGKEILFLPDSFKKPGNFLSTNNANILQRTETINKLSNSNTTGEIIVTYPEAIIEKVVQPALLEKETIFMKVGEKLDADFIIDVLVENGFTREDFVYEPGQFSVRGGIIDIFSFGNELPYRVELFDDEVDSIRTFDIENQLSQRKIEQVTIVPNMQTEFDGDQKCSLFDILPENTAVICQEVQFCLDIADQSYRQLKLAAAAETEQLKPEILKGNVEDGFIKDVAIEKSLSRLPLAEIGSNSKHDNPVKIDFNCKPQPSFNKNFELLVKNIDQLNKNNTLAFLFTDNPRQHERFNHIFEDIGADIKYFPVPNAISKGFIDEDLNLACYTDHQIFERYHKFKMRKGYAKSKSLSLKVLKELRPGDFVTHIDHGVGMYSGLEKIEVNGMKQETVRLIYDGGDLLYVNINSLHKIAKYRGKEGTPPKPHKLGSDKWNALKRKTKKRVKDIAKELIQLYAKRRASKGFAFAPDSYLQHELEASFFFEDTPDQYKATEDVKRDMEAENPMDRLICGDVGFGKTEVAVRAAFKAVADSKQVAVLVPTTILAFQHYRTFLKRLGDLPCEVEYINRFKTAKEKKAILQRLEEGKLDILIGTHAIVGKSVKFKDLGLLIIDEEQKFGVAMKEKLRKHKTNVDTLTLTATPIPRTLQFSLMGARDLSIINTAPPNRQPVETELHPFNVDMISEAIYYEIYRGGQVFFVHNRVKDIMDIKAMLDKLCPDLDIDIAHGQMEGADLEKKILQFMDKKIDVLVCTTIVENGLDIPNMNTIIINNAHQHGLSDLHQLRGRVGRSNKKAFCYLISPPMSTLTTDARKRLRAISEFADLGSGFHIAMRDLDIRGAGNLLGGEQSGFINEIGYETYQKILHEAMMELKETEFKDLFKEETIRNHSYISECQIDTDLEMLIPDGYVNNIQERLSIYGRLNEIKNEEGIKAFSKMLLDRFGPIPKSVNELFNALRLKWVAIRLGLEKVVIQRKKLKCYFIENQESSFYESPLFHSILAYIQSNPQKCSLKQTNKYLILTFEGVPTMKSANSLLQHILQFCTSRNSAI